MMATMMSVKWYFIVVLIGIDLIIIVDCLSMSFYYFILCEYNLSLETWPCLEFFSDEIPQDISWGQMSFKALSNLWLFGALQHLFYGFPAHSVVKESTCNAADFQETWARSLVLEDPWRRKWQTTLVFLPGESHGHHLSWQATVHGVAKSRTRLSS